MAEDAIGLDEVVVVGYGTQKKVHLTASVTQVNSEVLENRPVSNTAQALQGAAPNLSITTTNRGGEPGASMNMNIRGFMQTGTNWKGDAVIENSSPLVMVDGVQMDMNAIDPEDIETVSILKDAAAASIYGARAAGGAIIITTKSGKSNNGRMKVSYSNNFALSQPTVWPKHADAYTFAQVWNDAQRNTNGKEVYTEEMLGWIQQNMEDPGSAPTLVEKPGGLSWNHKQMGVGATGSTDWKAFLFKDWASRQKHNINFSGGDEKLNYYISSGFYDEEGLTNIGDEYFNRYNVDAKISSKATDWLTISLLTKFRKSEDEFPWDYQYQRGRIFDLINKMKPTMPTVDPTFGEPLVDAQYPKWKNSREKAVNNQIAILPRVVIEPVKDWIINLEYNYKRNNNMRLRSMVPTEYKRPNGDIASTPARSASQVESRMVTNEYFSPNVYSTYTKSIGDHNFKILVGYQSELYESYNLDAEGLHLLSDNILSIASTVGERKVTDEIAHWSTQSVFSRFNYNYKEKYLFEVSYRQDGSSKFEPGSQWAGFPSFSAGYNIAKEDFWPLKDQIRMFKLRGSFGTLGNHNVPNYLYVPIMGISEGNYLFDGSWGYTASPPNLGSIGLSWDRVQTTDFGFDMSTFNDRLTVNADWYRSDIIGLGAKGEALPAVLGSSPPFLNVADIRTQGWEADFMWKDKIGEFGYNLRFSISDYKRTVLDFPNPTGLLSSKYAGQDLGEIWGLEWDGWFQTQEEIDNHPVDQTWVYGSWTPGDTRYVDQNGDNEINNGINTIDDHGDMVVIGNTTPRYQYGFSAGFDWKGIDFSMFIQGVGKRDINMGISRYRGPAQGPFHGNVFEEHVDYWRDETSSLGANPDAYYPKPYLQNPGKNKRNYGKNVDRYIQDASYIRLKTMQLGYTIPKSLTQKAKLNRVRIYVSGENLLTKSNIKHYDPEVTNGTFGSGIAYPLAKVVSTGVNISF
jgi:TonB-linked SusC/RagA family outer membrane protein